MTSWPSHSTETVPWRQRVRGGTREDRMLTSIDLMIPPFIADQTFTPPASLTGLCESAIVAISHADAAAHAPRPAIGRLLLRTESVASSKIERLVATSEDYARAVAGSRANPSATSMVAASAALHRLVTAGDRGALTEADLLDAHRALMVDDPDESDYAGRVREVQNWIGGSDHSPRDALYVPPGPERLASLFDDLIAYVNRDDVPVITQAAIAHAQFESIHPFTDGNGRIGRGLISAILRRRGAAKNAVLPLASGLLARRDGYFEALGAYRTGHPEAIITLIAESANLAAQESLVTIERVEALPEQWRSEIGVTRRSALTRLLDELLDQPVITVAEVERISGTKAAQAHLLVDRLAAAGIIHEITGRRRDRAWVASDLLAELDDLDRRIHSGMR